MGIFQEKGIKHIERNNEALSDIYTLNSYRWSYLL